jgi:NodT family efflux transporter outer membrane factor (OMF) lipoprotein
MTSVVSEGAGAAYPVAQVWRIYATISLTATLLLAACAVGPNFKRPQSPQTASYTAEPLPPQTAASQGPAGAAQTFAYGDDIPAQWWNLFHSEQLNSLVERSLESSPDVAAAQAALREAHEDLLAQEGGLLPTIDGNASGVRQRISGAAYGQPQLGSFIYNLFNATVNVSYTLDVWGGVRRSVEAAGAQAEYQNFQLEATYLTLSANVVTTAIQDASLRAQIEATQQIIEADCKQLVTVERQLALGGVSRLDVLTQQTQLANELASLQGLHKNRTVTCWRCWSRAFPANSPMPPSVWRT